MDVVLRVPRQLEVDDDRQVLDVEPAGRDVGRDEHPDVARLEPSRARVRSGCERSLWIADRVEALAVEPRREAGCGDLRPREHEHLAQVARPDQVGEQRLLAVAIDRVDELPDRLDDRVPRRDLDRRPGRAGSCPTGAGSRRRTSPRTSGSGACAGQQLDDPLDVGQEAHVEHPVRLVEDEDLDLAEVGDLLADEVEQPARASRRGSRRRPRRALICGIHRDAAVDDGRAQRHGPRRRSGRSRRPASRARASGRGSGRGRGGGPARSDVFACCRSRSRIGSVKAAVLPVPVWAAARTSRPCEDEGDGRFLDRRGLGVALFGDGPEEIGRQAERIEGQAGSCEGPGRRGRGPRERDGGAGSARAWARPACGRPEHSRNLRDPEHARSRPRRHPVTACTGHRHRTPGRPACCVDWHTCPRPPGLQTTRQTGTTQRTPPPRQDPVAPRRVPALDGRGPAHPDRASPSLARIRESMARPTPVRARPFLSVGGTTTVIAPPSAMFRQRGGKDLAGTRQTAPSGRPATGHFA